MTVTANDIILGSFIIPKGTKCGTPLHSEVNNSYISHLSMVNNSCLTNCYVSGSHIYNSTVKRMYLYNVIIKSATINDDITSILYWVIGPNYIKFSVDSLARVGLTENTNNSIIINCNSILSPGTYIGEYMYTDNIIKTVWNVSEQKNETGNIKLDDYIRPLR